MTDDDDDDETKQPPRRRARQPPTLDSCIRAGALNHVPAVLRIEIVYEDDDIVVVRKPRNLRSVPGHADPPPSSSSEENRKRKADDGRPSTKMTAQEAWIQALGQLVDESKGMEEDATQQPSSSSADDDERRLQTWMRRLAGQPRTRASIPRRYAAFGRYLRRSRHRVFFDDDDDGDDRLVERVTPRLFQRVQRVQQTLLAPHRPTPTTREESVVGQLQLLRDVASGNPADAADAAAVAPPPHFRVVHRLDCQTSGLLVLARTAAAASFLSACWRRSPPFPPPSSAAPNDNDDDHHRPATTTTTQVVTKVYRAWVDTWPDGDEGEIRLPLAPHPTQRLKWHVVDDDANGKSSVTRWKVLERRRRSSDDGDDGVILELRPLTGRTHQLRIHCAATASPIRGDTLYGDVQGGGTSPSSPSPPPPPIAATDLLYLHAEKLSFPHPTTREIVSFQVDPRWW